MQRYHVKQRRFTSRTTGKVTGKVTEISLELPAPYDEVENESPLHVAALNNHVDLIDLFVREHGADVDVVTKNNLTPLHKAAKNCSLDAIHYLVELGGDVLKKDKFGKNVRGNLLLVPVTNPDREEALQAVIGYERQAIERKRSSVAKKSALKNGKKK